MSNLFSSHSSASFVHLDWLPVGVCLVDRNLRVLGWNRVLEDWTGKLREQVNGHELLELFPNLKNDRVQCRLRSVLTSRSPIVLSATLHQSFFPVTAADGTPMVQKTTIRPCHDEGGELMIVVEDVTVSFRQMEKLRKKKEHLTETVQRLELAEQDRLISQELRNTAAECAGIGFWDWDIEQDRLVWDDTMYSNYGLSKNETEVNYRLWQRLVHPDDLARTEWELQLFLDGAKPFDTIFRIRRPDGEMRHIHAAAHLVRNSQGKPIRMVGANVDVTAQVLNESRLRASRDQARTALAEAAEAKKNLEEQAALLARQNTELAEAQTKAEAATRSKSEFLANMSHEIRTPMTSILGYTDLLLNDQSSLENPEQRVAALQTIQRNGKHLLEIINDLLDLSKIEANRMTLETVPCSPWALVQEVTELLRVRAEAKGLEIRHCVATAIPDLIDSDPTRLRQILLNLIGNAIKFTEQGAVTITIRCVSQQSGGKIEFDVQDTGIGMTNEQLAGLFRPFAQADTTMTRRFGGTGLGLTISRRFAIMLGGDIHVESKQGVGSCFRVSIDTGDLAGRSFSSPTTINQKQSKNSKSNNKSLPTIPCRILLAEDGPDNQRLISFVLRKAGAEVTLADDGQRACDLIAEAEVNGTPFDIVLMDMQMPVLDGYAATQQLRNRGYSKPIIALTAHAMQGDREKCIAAGCTDFDTKPIDRERLLRVIASHLATATAATY